MEAEHLKMDTIANNLANVNTTGFKRTRAEFQDLLSETIIAATPAGPQGGGQPAPLQVGLGVRTGTTTRSMAQGDRIGTQNPFDLAIDGPGYFRIQRANGDVAFTRAGNLRVDETGRLVTQSGEIVEPSITVPPETAILTIRPDGTVLASLAGRTDPQELGQLELTTFTNPGALSAIGNNLFQPTAATGQEIRQKPGEQGMGTLSQGFLESANVKAVEEMIDMITTQRSYEMNSKVITTADQMLQKLTNLR
jgi:flagellar basal-body rod protein FlgG